MAWKAWLYFGFSAVLVVVLMGITVYYFRDKRKKTVEEPKYRMLDED